jgi:aminodeoxyfutalosine deaminase
MPVPHGTCVRVSGAMNNSFPREFVRALPKAELHVHLEGTVDAATLLALAERHGIEPPADDEAGVNAWYRFDGFPAFLERYLTVTSMLRDPEDFAFIAERYLLAAHQQGVVHVEFHISACAHLIENNKPWPPIYDAIVAGCRRAEAVTGISWGLIPDISPHLPASECERAMTKVLDHDLTGVVAVGMGGPADTWFTDDFTPIFRQAKSEGLHSVSHAAEHGGPREVVFAVEQFGAERIQHGIGVMADPAAVQLLVERGIACDVCPGSNLALQAVDSPAAHPLPAMLHAGIKVTLGSDDPPMFQTNLLDEYERAWNWCALTRDGLRQLAANSLEASFAPPARVSAWMTQLEACDSDR